MMMITDTGTNSKILVEMIRLADKGDINLTG